MNYEPSVRFVNITLVLKEKKSNRSDVIVNKDNLTWHVDMNKK